MTKKDYIFLAKLLRETKPQGHGQTLHYWYGMVITLSDRLKGDNPNFNAATFLKACGHDPTIIMRKTESDV